MKFTFQNLIGLFIIGMMFTFSSCKEDEPDIDPGEGTYQLANGSYLKADGADPSSSAGLSAESVEDSDFQSQSRDGFSAGYMYLSAGNYTILQVEDKEEVGSIGGSATTITDMSSDCGYNDYTLVAASDGGPAFNVANDGLYKVTHDAMTNEIVLYQIESMGVIGSATDNGWSADTPLAGTINADGASWTLEGAVLRQGEYKLRLNCRWNLDRRIDPTAGFDASNGYQLFTNFGGTPDNLTPGNDDGNFPVSVDDEGTYTLTVNWSPQDGFSMIADKTGPAPDLEFDPAEHRWGVIGDATANSWDADRNMYYKGLIDGAHTWLGVVTLGDGNFKFRINDDWGLNIGGILEPGAGLTTLERDGADIASPGAGAYFITISTADEGVSWNASMEALGWGIIGDGSPQGNWDADIDMTADGFTDGITTYSVSGTFTSGGQFKFRAADDWAYNLGGDTAGLSADGDNLSVDADGDYNVVLSYDGETYTATIDPQ